MKKVVKPKLRTYTVVRTFNIPITEIIEIKALNKDDAYRKVQQGMGRIKDKWEEQFDQETEEFQFVSKEVLKDL